MLKNKCGFQGLPKPSESTLVKYCYNSNLLNINILLRTQVKSRSGSKKACLAILQGVFLGIINQNFKIFLKKVEKSFGGVKKGRIFAVPFREGAWAPVPGTLGQVHWKDRKARKKQVPRKRESERRFIPGDSSPGSYRDEAGPGSDKAK